jgi:hypothetical protein
MPVAAIGTPCQRHQLRSRMRRSQTSHFLRPNIEAALLLKPSSSKEEMLGLGMKVQLPRLVPLVAHPMAGVIIWVVNMTSFAGQVYGTEG